MPTTTTARRLVLAAPPGCATSAAIACPLAAGRSRCRCRSGCRRGRRRRRRRWSRRRCWSRCSRCRRWSGPTRQHSNISATVEPLDIVVIVTPTRAAVEIPMETAALPPLRLDLLPVAAIIRLRYPVVSSPPAPLQYALIAAQVGRNNVTEFLCLGQGLFRCQVEALWVQGVNRMAVCSGIVRNAIRRGLCTYQRPPGASVVDPHLNVTMMVGCDRMLHLDHLTTGVSRSDGFFCTTR